MAELAAATLGGGCFWCLEAIFQRLAGVESVASGYAGGEVENPSYREVCAGTTGHAEVVQIRFDPAVISFVELLDVFWRCHDPTTPNRQGADVGTQYRSIILFHDEAQRLEAEQSMAELKASGVYGRPPVTEIVPLGRFYAAENYHQNYYNANQTAPYCRMVIRPKLEKLDMV